MDDHRFDALAKLLGAAGSRRGALATMVGLAASGAVVDAEARRRRCRRDSPTGQCCRKDGTCTCTDGGAVCGVNCCTPSQACEDGACVAVQPACIPAGEACKDSGRICCGDRTCASGQGGQTDIACYAPKTGRCATNSDCVYGTYCENGSCVGIPIPTGCTSDAQCRVPDGCDSCCFAACLEGVCGNGFKAIGDTCTQSDGFPGTCQDKKDAPGIRECVGP